MSTSSGSLTTCRQKIIALVRKEQEAREVFSHLPSDEADPSGRKLRRGWRRLIEYFEVAAPGEWSTTAIKYLAPSQSNDFPAWCALFALWALKSAGAQVGVWKMGHGISSVTGIVATATPAPGDIAYLTAAHHHCIVVEVNRVGHAGGTVVTIDGNSGPHGEIAERTRAFSEFAGFYTAKSLQGGDLVAQA